MRYMDAWNRLPATETVSYSSIHASRSGRGERFQIRHRGGISTLQQKTAERRSKLRQVAADFV